MMTMEEIAKERRKGYIIKIIGPVRDREGYWWVAWD